MEITPIIFDDSSHRSLLTLDDPSECKVGGPVSIIQLLEDAKINTLNFVSPNMHSFMKAMKVCEKHKIKLNFGLEIWVTDDAARKDEQSRANESKVIVWLKNATGNDGYADFVNLHNAFMPIRGEDSEAKYFYYHMRYDWRGLKEHWSENLALSVPFFDSFLSRNLLNYGSQIIPDFPTKPALHREINAGHPHEGLINAAIDRFNKDGEYEVVNTKTVYYRSSADFKTYYILRCIKNKSNFEKPELEYLVSPNFSWEDYLRLTKE